DRQYIAPRVDNFDRGTIYFSEKDGTRVSAATLKSGFTLAINPSQITDISGTYEKLSSVVEIEKELFFFRAGKTDDPYEEILKQLDEKQAEEIDSLDLDGVILVRRNWRFYPAGNMASHVLGFVGYKGNVFSGQYGLERFHNDILERGEDELFVNFFAEVFSNISKAIKNDEKNNRKGNVITSIEPSTQGVLEEELSKLQTKWNSEVAGGIIINPKNGEIYALSSLPDFNPNEFNIVSDQAVFRNPLVQNVYEMGSIVKPLTMAIGLDTGMVSYDSTYDDKGYVLFGDAKIQNYDGRARGIISMQEVLNQSLNTGAVHVMQEVGKETFRDYLYKFEINEKTGIDLPHEASALVSNLKGGREIEYATASFGQGFAVSPVAMVRALSVLANGGYLATPHTVKEIDYTLGFPETVEIKKGKQVLKPETSEEISRMLVEVVDTALKNGEVKNERYSVAAKTGTAQIANPDGSGYYDDRYLHSFFGYFPAYDPQFLVFLYTVNPKEVRYASETLTDPFINITKFLINYYAIPPDR
ncbi:MAG: penicillin-binding protein 2, partial [Candidatus Pacebacteria bacterium]|nr:penicillin-binding protein 2 [Candidatus Paceibacterota bacterium]